MIQTSQNGIDFIPSMGQKLATLATRRRPHDIATIIVSTTAPSPELLNRVGHAILRSIAIGQGDPLRHAADALGRLADLLPDASPEGRMIAVLLAVTDDATSQPVVTVQSPAPTPARRKSKPAKQAKTSRKSKAAVPTMDINGRLLSSRKINDTDVISQAEARKALGMNCPQMIKLENQKLLTRIQEGGSRLVFYDVCQVQHLLDKLDATPPPPL